MAEFIRSKRGGFILASKGFLYHKTNKSKGRWYWVCSKKPECNVRCVSTGEPPDNPTILKEGRHDHAPDQDDVTARKLVESMKNVAAEHPEMLPATIIRDGLSQVGDEVLPKLPERPSLKRAINRKRQAELPRNPQTLGEIRELPEIYRKTLSGKSAQFSVIFFKTLYNSSKFIYKIYLVLNYACFTNKLIQKITSQIKYF